MNIIKGSARIIGDEVSTDIHCSSKYLPGKDAAYIATVAFEQVAPGFAKAFNKGDVIVAGKNFGINSSREQAVHVMHRMGVAAIIAPSFGRQFYRNAINNGMPVIVVAMKRSSSRKRFSASCGIAGSITDIMSPSSWKSEMSARTSATLAMGPRAGAPGLGARP